MLLKLLLKLADVALPFILEEIRKRIIKKSTFAGDEGYWKLRNARKAHEELKSLLK